MRAKAARALVALVLCGNSSALSPPLSARVTVRVDNTLLDGSSLPVSQQQRRSCCTGRSGGKPPRVSPLRLFGLGSGESSSAARGSAGGASQARRAVEENAAFKSRMAKVRERERAVKFRVKVSIESTISLKYMQRVHEGN